MPPRRPATQQSLKIPKGKDVLTGEASNPTIVEGTEKTPKVEPVI
jgi:hypothetical protein